MMNKSPPADSRELAQSRRREERNDVRNFSMWGNDPESIAWRKAQAMVDADIEGLPRDAKAEALLLEMAASGLSNEEQRQRLIAYFEERLSLPHPAK